MSFNRKNKIKCKRCGRCCVFGELREDCKYLVRYQDGHTRCLIYRHRIGAEIRPDEYCSKRGNNYIPGCPYNKLDKNGRLTEKIR